jgi:uridylate kinase
MVAVVVKISGRAMDGPPGVVAEYLTVLSKSMARLNSVFEIAITVGGGQRARELIGLAIHFGCRDVAASLIGGDIGLAHCRVLCAALASAGVPVRQPIDSWSRAADEMKSGIVPVLYGYWPGMTSDAVAVYLADFVGAPFVLKLSNINAIYTCDPSIEGALPIDQMSHEELEAMALRQDRRIAGSSFVLDLVAARRLSESGITLVFGHMSNVDVLVSAFLDGDAGPTQGTIVSKPGARWIPRGG